MKRLRRIVFTFALVVVVICVVLLLNITAPNPTGRRYSSRVVLTTGGGPQIGQDAENVLAADLHLPNNNAPDQRQCLCGNQSYAASGQCRVCVITSPEIDTYRIPDFIAPGFIAEAKNRQGLPYTSRDADQIADFAMAAVILNRALWLYIRVDTNLDPQYEQLVEETGGGVVRYFATPGFVDATDVAARNGLAVSVVIMGGIGWWEISTRRRLTGTPRPKPKNPLDKAVTTTDRAESFGRRSKDRAQRDLDRQAARDDLDD